MSVTTAQLRLGLSAADEGVVSVHQEATSAVLGRVQLGGHSQPVPRFPGGLSAFLDDVLRPLATRAGWLVVDGAPVTLHPPGHGSCLLLPVVPVTEESV